MTQPQFDFARSHPYTLVASPNRSGFFGLSDLQRFTSSAVQPYADAPLEQPLVLDFSHIKVWDISALLWLVVALHHYRQHGMPFLLRLPAGDPSMSPSDVDAFNKSADFLRRWRFDDALRNLTPEPATLLVPEQHDFFSNGQPRHFYRDQTVLDGSGVLQSLLSRRLVHIRNLADPAQMGQSAISDNLITNCIADFQSARIGDILRVQCGIEKRYADLFADHLLTEALQNVREHPNATIGMIAISIMGRTNELVLSVVDNGTSIPHTIYLTYRRSNGIADERPYNREHLEMEEIARITDYATKAGVTSKSGAETEKPDVGMGLAYIREDTIKVFYY